MKILHVITSLHIGGAEKLMVDMLPLMRSKGNEVELLVFNGIETSFSKQLNNDSIKIHQLGLGSVYHPYHIIRLRKYLKQFDIVHTHNTAPQFFVPLAHLLSSSKAKLVTTEHNTYNRRRAIKGFRYLDRLMYGAYHSIISISSKATENLFKYIGKKYEILTIENGINLSVYSGISTKSCQELGLPINKILLTQVAGFRPQKDQDTLIRALLFLPENIHAVFVGEGERRDECEKLVESLGLQNRIHFLGIRSDVSEILKVSDLIVMSSHYEGLSLSSLEGMSVNKPFIASNVPGLKEVVEGAGMLFEHQNDVGLAKIIQQLVDDTELYEDVSKKCKQRAMQFDISKTVSAYLKVYQNLIKNG